MLCAVFPPLCVTQKLNLFKITFWNPYFKDNTVSFSEIFEKGKVCSIVNPDEFDKKFGKWLEYGFETIDEYLFDKEYALRTNYLNQDLSGNNQ